MRRVVASAVAALALVCAAPANANRTAAVDAAGAVHTFVVGTDGALYHAPPGGVLARAGGSGLVQEPVAAARDASGEIVVAARGEDGTVYVLPGGDWSARVPVATGAAGSPELLPLSDGNLELYYRGLEGKLWAVAHTVTGWQAPVALADDAAGDPTAILDRDGAIFIVYRSVTGEIVTPGGPSLGAAAGDPAVVRYPDGRLAVFARAADGTLWQATQELPLYAFATAAQLTADPVVGNPAVVIDGARNLHVFARDASGALRELTRAAEPLGGTLSGDPVAIRDRFGLIQLFAPSAGAAWVTRAQSAVLTFEPGFRSLGEAAPPADRPLAAVQPTPTPTPTVVPPTYAPKRLVVDLRANAKASRTSTRFKDLTLRDVPAGATVSATCEKGCKRSSLTFKNVAGTVSLKPFFAKRAKQGTLKAGTKIRVVVSAPNMIAAVKTLTVRARRAPTVATRCLAPGATAEALCAA